MNPATLQSAPTGINFSAIPSIDADPDQRLAEQWNICWRATSMVDTFVNQPLRADLCQEEIMGPSFRMNIDNTTGICRALTSRWPVTEVVGGRFASSSIFRNINWTTLLPTQLRTYQAIQTIGSSAPDSSGVGPNFIDIEPGNIVPLGRNSFRVQLAYVSGWPHTSLTESSLAGATTLTVDDVTGWAGTVGQIYDGAETESVTVASVAANTTTTIFGQTVPTGPGTLTLTAPLSYNHQPQAIVSSLPADIQWATILYCCVQALTRGGVATQLPATGIPGAFSTASYPAHLNVGRSSVGTIQRDAEQLLLPYRRVI